MRFYNQARNYRADIDGLRAVAVLAVILYHINADLLVGGFAGVDIFFVISGYLITGNILRDAASAKGFSWVEFYRRRILRILPVLFCAVFFTLLAGYFIFLPEDLAGLSNSAVAALLSVPNIYFTYFLDTSYFADDSNLQPLLHLWSLGVEEQFYIFWPIILVFFLTRISHGWALVSTAIIAILSFLLAEMLLASLPMFAYYMLPARAGELLIGAMLATWQSKGSSEKLTPLLSNVMALLGTALITYSLLVIQEDLGFPGVNALPATAGAALIIWAGSGEKSLVSRLLSFSPVVWIGLLSYSLYLWHWPLLAFYRYIYGEVGAVAGVVLFGLMLLLSYLSYRLVEKPLRQRKWSLTQVIGRVGGAGVLIASLCVSLIMTNGYGLYKYDGGYMSQVELLTPGQGAYKHDFVCQRPRLRDSELNSEKCIINSSTAAEPNILLWGDSNASHYVGVVKVFAEESGFSFRNAAHSSCPPILRGAKDTQRAENAENCLASIDVVKSKLDRYGTIILAASWSDYVNRSSGFLEDLEFTLKKLTSSGKKVIILAKMPVFKGVDRKCERKNLSLAL